MPLPHTALISDDLTGALDSAVPFALMGWHVAVATGLAALGRALQLDADVVAVSLNSREIDSAEAQARARTAAQMLADVPTVFKKIDSRMKGHVLAEAAEIAAVRSIGRLILCPAIPELGRSVQDGHVVGHGIDAPIPVRPPSQGLIDVMCPDARSDADLSAVVANREGALLVGARGLAFALARSMGAALHPVAQAPSLAFPLTVVVGSRDETTLEQVARLRRADPAALWYGAPDGLAPDPDQTARVSIVQAIAGTGADGATVAARLAKSVVPAFQKNRRTMLLTGGETAAACLREMGACVLHLLGEAQAGMPISLPFDMDDAPHIITKSGGFGDPDCLVTLVRSLIDQGAT